jgi:hypothetical protein
MRYVVACGVEGKGGAQSRWGRKGDKENGGIYVSRSEVDACPDANVVNAWRQMRRRILGKLSIILGAFCTLY